MSEDNFIVIHNNRIYRPIWGDRVMVLVFEIFSNPIIHIAEVKQRRFNIIDRVSRFWEIIIRNNNIEIN